MSIPTSIAAAILATATATLAFTPSPHSFVTPKRTNSQEVSRPNASNSRAKFANNLRLFPDPSLEQGFTSAIETSSIVTSDFIESLSSTIGSLLLLGSVGAGVYAGVMEEGAEKSMDEGTADDMVPVEMSAKPVLEEAPDAKEIEEKIEESVEQTEEQVKEAVVDVDEIIEEGFVEPVVAAGYTAAATSQKVLQSTEEAIKEVQKKGVAETKEKMNSKTAASSAFTAPTPSSDEESKAVVVSESTSDKDDGDNKAVGKKRKIVKGIGFIVAAAGVVAARKLVQAWIGRGLI
mmetsp:Transcript_9655/g.20042  ORF Transcript_9655/g.20042 Transcript_9655/m.20042 type:complete len:291 (-) Transcript_9655:412-1284(-)